MKRLLKYVMRATLAAAFAVLGISPAAAQSAVQAEGQGAERAAAAGDKPEGAHLVFDSAVVDLGDVKINSERIEVDLGYSNDGTVPAVITEARTGCTCVMASYRRGKIMPGDRGTLEITLDPVKAPAGKFFRVIQIFSNSPSGVARITVKANIVE